MSETKDRIEKIRAIFPQDERLRNAILMAMGCTDQLPVLNDAFRKTLFALPDPSDTIPWENETHLAVAEVLLWSARIELALHDLRQSLFFRFNNRIKHRQAPTKEELDAAVGILTNEPLTPSTPPEPPPPFVAQEEPKPKKKIRPQREKNEKSPGSRIADLFGDQ
jgi:hypothetical protein